MADENYVINISTEVDDASLKAFKANIESIEKKAGNVKTGIDSTSKSLNDMGKTGTSATHNITTGMQGIDKAASNNSTNISAAATAFNTYSTASDSAVNSVTKGFNTASNSASNFVKNVSGGASTAFNGFKSAADSAINSVVKGFQSAGTAASNFINNLSGVQQGIMGIMGAIGTASIGNLIFGNTMKAETNKVLLKGMTSTATEADSLFNVVDNATNKSLMSMQDLIPALNAVQKSTGATGATIESITPSMANFGSYVYAMTGSANLASTATFDLAKGLNGAFASLDQYGITEQTLMDTGLWTGKKEDVEGYMAAVDQVIGSTDEFMDTTQGKLATLSKKFSIAGKQLGQDMMPTINWLIDGFNNLNTTSDGWAAKIVVAGGGVLSTLLMIAPGLQSTIQLASGAGSSIRALAGFFGLAKTAEDAFTLATMRNTIAQKISAIATAIRNTAQTGSASASAVAVGAAAAHTSATNVNTAATNLNALSYLKAIPQLIAMRVAQAAATVQQWLLNAAFLANPITWVVIAIVALVAILWHLYNTNETVRNAIDGLWAGLQQLGSIVYGALMGAFTWLKNTLTDLYNAFVNNPIAQFALKILSISNPILFIITHFNTLKTVVGTVIKFAIDSFNNFQEGSGDAITKVKDFLKGLYDKFQWLKDMVMPILQPIIDGINAIKDGWEYVTNAASNTEGSKGSVGSNGSGTGSSTGASIPPLNWSDYITSWLTGDWSGKINRWTDWQSKINRWTDWKSKINKWTDWASKINKWTDWASKINKWTNWTSKITKWTNWTGRIDRWTDWGSKITPVNLANFVSGVLSGPGGPSGPGSVSGPYINTLPTTSGPNTTNNTTQNSNEEVHIHFHGDVITDNVDFFETKMTEVVRRNNIRTGAGG